MTVGRLIKRLVDALVATIALLILTPLLLPVMLALRLTGEGEVFYRQKRIGFQNGTFNILKFATMLKNSPNMGTGSLTVRGDPRVTPLGHGLRATKINELPQLINVLIGDMSFVGPRPQMQIDFDVYPAPVRERIYEVCPGVTGIGSIVFRDEERLLSRDGIDPRQFYSEKIAPYKGALEMWYLDRQCLWLDAQLMVLTVLAVLRPDSDAVYRRFPDLPTRPEWMD